MLSWSNTTRITDLCFNQSLLVGHYYVGIRKEKNMSCLILPCRTWSKCISGRLFYTLCTGKHGRWYKTNSHFPNFDANNSWKMGHNSQLGFILGQELLLDFALWIDLTSNADNLPLLSVVLEVTEFTVCFFKTCWWLTGLSRLYDAYQPPGRLQGTWNNA